MLQNLLKHFLISPWSCFTRIMNGSLGLGAVNSVLRIAIWCFSPDLWLEPDLSGSGVAWHGIPAWDFADMKSRMGLRYEVVTELPEPEGNLYGDMIALMRGMADISIDYWGVNYERSKLVDFSYPDLYTGVYIYRVVHQAVHCLLLT